MIARTNSRSLTFVASIVLLSRIAFSADAPNPYIGHWALTIPGGGAGWLGVSEKDGKLAGMILWGGGSVVPVDAIMVDGNTLVIGRKIKAGGKAATETITAKATGDDLTLTTAKADADGKPIGKPAEFTGKRTPALPPAPDLAKVKYGAPVTLLNGKDLTGWKLVNPQATNGWVVKDGVLTNDVTVTPGKPHNFGNLRTEAEFEDFNLTLETNVPKGGNSGVYLRGIYEIQVVDSYGKALDPHNMGAVYSRITPTVAAEKPAGEWQTLDITLVNRHVTVILNGKKIIDNQPVQGCTGGALWSDPLKPGPIYLQGDHTGANYRNMVLKPVVKE